MSAGGHVVPPRAVPITTASRRTPPHRSTPSTLAASREVSARAAALLADLPVRRAPSDRSTLLDAVALQDHYVKSMKLDLGRPPPMPRIPVRAASATAHAHPFAEYDPRAQMASTEPTPDTRWTCERCTLLNSGAAELCMACGAEALMPEDATRKVRLTLAQRRGLVPAPPPQITKDEWKVLEEKAATRLSSDAATDCAICMEPFGMDDQVILSCSHMFHERCLRSFEQFVRVRERTCPLCRKANYEKKRTRQGRKAHVRRCAVTVQAAFRGWRVRRHFFDLRREFHAMGGGDAAMRRRFIGDSLGRLSDKLNVAVARESDAIDALFAEVDRDVAASRHIMEMHDGVHGVAAPWDPDGEDSDVTDDDAIEWAVFEQAAAAADPLPPVDWEAVVADARRRAATECPICLCPFASSEKSTDILSCGHVFHHRCVSAFERFTLRQPKCPVCRSAYQRRRFVL